MPPRSTIKAHEFIDTDLVPDEPSSSPRRSSNQAGRPVQQVPTKAELQARVEQTRQQMQDLQRQQELLDKERRELEELRAREEEFEEGKREMLAELIRCIGMIEQEEFDLNKRTSLLSHFRESFQACLHQLNSIRETEWTSGELKTELSKAAMVLDGVRAELNKGRAQLTLGEGQDLPISSSGADGNRDLQFGLEFRRGLARSLPLILFGLIVLLVWLLRS
jgi:predicted nuclease with TOPRIM domain